MARRRRAAVVFVLLFMPGIGYAAARHAKPQPSSGAAARPWPPQTQSQPSTEQLARGKAVFDEWCAGCHAPGPRRPGTQALEVLYKGTKPAALEERTDLVPKLTETFVRKGVSVMPPFRKTEITDAQLADLAAYLAPKRR